MDDLATIIQRAQDGDEAAFTVLVQRFHSMAVRVCYSILGDWQLAEDAAQEAFVALSHEVSALRVPAAFSAWFRLLLVKHCDRLTRRRNHPLVPLHCLIDHAQVSDDPSRLVLEQEERDSVRVALHALPEPEYAAAMPFYLHEQPQTAIGAALGVPVHTIKNRLFSARKHIRAQIGTRDELAATQTVGVSGAQGREVARERGMLLYRRYRASSVGDRALLRQAINDLSRAVQSGDQQPATIHMLHDALYMSANLPAIVRLCARYARSTKDPLEIAWARQHLAVTYAQLGHSRAAAQEHAALIGQLRRTVAPEILLRSFGIGEIAQAWKDVGALDLFRDMSQSLAAAVPASPDGDRARAVALRTLAESVAIPSGEWDEAISVAEQLLAVSSDDHQPRALAMRVNAQSVLLAVACQRNDDERAADALGTALRDLTRSQWMQPADRSTALHDLGTWCLRLGIYHQARILLEHAVALEPFPETHLHLSAAVRCDDGNRELARRHFQRALVHPRLSVRHIVAARLRNDPRWEPTRHDPIFGWFRHGSTRLRRAV